MRRSKLLIIGVGVLALISVVSLIRSLTQIPLPVQHTVQYRSPSFEEIDAHLNPEGVEGDFQHDDAPKEDDYGYQQALLSKGTAPPPPTTSPDPLLGNPFRGRDCGGDRAAKLGTKSGDHCEASEECPEDHYCHYRKNFCSPFCNSVPEALKRDAAEWDCDACFKKCPYIQQSDCFRVEDSSSNGGKGKCSKIMALQECPDCKQVCTLANPTRNQQDTPRPDDIWITSYPKTGSTWVRHLVSNLYRANNKETQKGPSTFAEVDKFIPFLEDRSSWTSKTMFYEMTKPRVFKTHHPWQCDTFPCNNVIGSMARTQCMCPQCALHYKRVIYVYRNGQETLASYFRFRKGLGHVREHDHFGKFANQQRMYPGVTWADHVRSWKYAAKIGAAEVLWLAYEDLAKDPEGQMARIAKFLKLEATREELQFAIDASSKDTMKRMEKEAGGLAFFQKRYKKNSDELHFVDSAEADAIKTPRLWQGDMKKEKREKWGFHNQKVMHCLDYKLDYGL